MTPKITIGITCYNAQDTIQNAIDTALMQDWPDFEILEDSHHPIIQEKMEGTPQKIRVGQ